MLASSVEFAALSSACFSVLFSSSGNGGVQLQAVSRFFTCVQSGPWYSFVIVISAWASVRHAADKLILKPRCRGFAISLARSWDLPLRWSNLNCQTVGQFLSLAPMEFLIVSLTILEALHLRR
jgi:hypothetical protein